MTNWPKVANLEALIAFYEDSPDFAELRGALDAAKRAQSCLTDLRLARDCCEAAAQFRGVGQLRMTPLHRAVTEHALVTTAAGLYVRATVTSSGKGERGAVAVVDRLTESQKRDHDALSKLRGKALAHVHPREIVDGEQWHREIAYVVAEGDGWWPACATKRIQTSPQTLTRLRSLLPVAIRLLEETYQKRMAALTKRLQSLAGLDEAARRANVDPIEFFESEEIAAQSIRPGPGRRVKALDKAAERK